MCDPKKIWTVLLQDEDFVQGSPNEAAREFLRTDLVEQTPSILKDCLDLPVNLHSLAVARSAVAAHVLACDLLGKILGTLTEEDLPLDQRDEAIAEAKAAMREYAESAARAALQAVNLPSGGMTEDLVYAHNHLVELQLKGVQPQKMTIRQLVETHPSAIYIMH